MEHWLTADKPCCVLGCGARDGNRMEPKLQNPVCADHQALTMAQISQCRNDPWARMKLLGDYPGCPPKYTHLGGDAL